MTLDSEAAEDVVRRLLLISVTIALRQLEKTFWKTVLRAVPRRGWSLHQPGYCRELEALRVKWSDEDIDVSAYTEASVSVPVVFLT